MKTPKRFAVFLFLCFVSTAILWQPFSLTLDKALHDPESLYLLLVLPTSVVLIISRWRSHDLMTHRGLWLGSALIALGAGLAIAAWLGGHGTFEGAWRSLGMLALVLLWIGNFAEIFGTVITRQFIFPLGFLFWMVPIPPAPLAALIQFLQWTSAVSAGLFFSILGTPVVRSGIVLNIPNLTIEVAQECSSLRSSLILILTTMVIGHLFLRSLWRQTLLVLLAVPVAVAKNAARIVTIGLLGTRVDPEYLTGRLHREGGVIFFTLALAAIAILLWLLRRGENPLSSPVRRLSPAG